MSETLWGWPALFLLGAYHGVNPGMGWLFAVALGLQEKSGRAVWKALLPITAGHALAIAAVIVLAWLLDAVLPLQTFKIIVAVILFALGIHRLRRSWHPRGGMQVGFADLTIWSFLMASAHGAGLMVLPILFGMSAAGGGGNPNPSHSHLGVLSGPGAGALAVVVHTLGYLLTTGLVAWVVYRKLGLALLRKAWLNLDLLWAGALIVTGFFLLLI